MKKLLLLNVICSAVFGFSQEKKNQNEASKNETYLKANALFLPIGVLNIGVEHGFSEHITGQADIFVSPWKSFLGKHAQIYILGFDGRYYFNRAFNKFYVGANISVARFNIQKWGYWNDNYYIHKDGEATTYIASNLYQKGYSVILGGIFGYQFKWKEKWNVDLYLGVGSMQSIYKGYDKLSGDRYDEGGDSMGREWNKSGEFLPYKGGIMIAYKLGK